MAENINQELNLRLALNELTRNDIKLDQRTREVIDDLAQRLGGFSRSGQSLGNSATTARYAFNDLDRALKSGRRRFADLGEELVDLEEQLEKFDDEDEKRVRREQLESFRQGAARAKTLKGLTDGIAAATQVYASYQLSTYKSIVNSYQSGATVFQTVADQRSVQLDAETELANKLAAVTGTVTTGLLLFAPISLGTSFLIAGAVTLASEGIAYLIGKRNEEEKFLIQALGKEMDASVKALQDAASVGAFFAGGLQELRDLSARSGLDVGQYSRVIKANREALTRYGGTATRGVRLLTGLNESLTDQDRLGLLNMGIGIEDQIDGLAKYMGVLGFVYNLDTRDSGNLKNESLAYLVNLKAIAAFTGEENQTAEQRAFKALADPAVFARLQREAGADPEKLKISITNFVNGFKLLPKEMEERFKQQFALGVVVDPVQTIAGIMVPAQQKVFDVITKSILSGDKDQEKVVANLLEQLKLLARQGKQEAINYGKTGVPAAAMLAQDKSSTISQVDELITTINQIFIQQANIAKTPAQEIAEARKGNAESEKIYTEMIDYQKNRVKIMKDLGEYLPRFSDITKEVFDKSIEFIDYAIKNNWIIADRPIKIGGAKPESEGGIGENFGIGPRREFKGKPPSPVEETEESKGPTTKSESVQPASPPALTEQNKSRVLENLTKWTGTREINRFGATDNRGHTHQGIDLGHTIGDPVIARAGGRVDFIGSFRGYGNAIIIDIGQGSDGLSYSNLYAHLLKDSNSVRVGDTVKAGDAIAKVGNTDTASGDPTKASGPGRNHWQDSAGQWYDMPPHLHLELRKNYLGKKGGPLSGTPVDPEGWNRAVSEELREYFKKQTIKEDKISSTNPPYTSGSADGYVQLADGRQIPVELLGNYSEVLTAMNSLVDTLDAHSSVLEDQLVVVG